ncbi:MAG: ABC transporter ATP-binding protein [Paracoccaceae bacterium]
MTDTLAPDTVCKVENLGIRFRSDEGLVTAVDGVSFEVKRGQTLGLVGESGSGKSVSTKAIMRLLPKHAILAPETRMHLRTKDGIVDTAQLAPNSGRMRAVRGGVVSMIFQEPMASFSPVYTIGNQISEAIRLHRSATRREAQEIGIDMLARVGLSNPTMRFDQYAHELSGGMRQRAMIALALSTRPQLLIADEPTTALDVTIQAQILELMRELQDEFGMAMLFITHDMGVIAQVADEVAVMYLGRIAERGSATRVIWEPKHPYTRGLIAAIPSLERIGQRLQAVPGDIPSPLERPTGCPFHTRCAERVPGRCDTGLPAEAEVAPDHRVACVHHALEAAE